MCQTCAAVSQKGCSGGSQSLNEVPKFQQAADQHMLTGWEVGRRNSVLHIPVSQSCIWINNKEIIDMSPLPPTICKLSQNILDTSTAFKMTETNCAKNAFEWYSSHFCFLLTWRGLWAICSQPPQGCADVLASLLGSSHAGQLYNLCQGASVYALH